MGSVRIISSIAVTAVLGALFGRRGRGDVHGEGPGQPASPPPPVEPSELVAEVATERMVDAAPPGSAGAEDPIGRSRSLKPIPHPIRPWELWHPATEPVHLFHSDAEERVSWSEIAEDEEAWAAPELAAAPLGPDDLHGEVEPSGSGEGEEQGADHVREGPDRSGGEDAERFGFGRLRPFTRSVLDDPHAGVAAVSGATGVEPGYDLGASPAPSPEGDGPAPEGGGGDVLFRELVSSDRMTASEHALETQDPQRSAGLLINGPVSRRTDRAPDRSRRRLPVALRVVGGDRDRSADGDRDRSADG